MRNWLLVVICPIAICFIFKSLINMTHTLTDLTFVPCKSSLLKQKCWKCIASSAHKNGAFSRPEWRPVHHLWIQTAVTRTKRHWVLVMSGGLNELVSGRRCWFNTGALLWQALQYLARWVDRKRNITLTAAAYCLHCMWPFSDRNSCSDLLKTQKNKWPTRVLVTKKVCWMFIHWLHEKS